MIPKRLLPLLFAALLLLPSGACSPRKPKPARPLNVIFILVDTLRADHLGIYGYPRDTSPNLDAFARRSVFFREARSQASCTFPSVNSILTSRYPAAFLGQPGQAMGIPANVPSLAEILRLRGYRTVAVSASAVVRNTPSQHNPGAGFGRGFEVFQEDCVWKAAACVNRQVLGRLKRDQDADAADRPLFLYIHYIDPHGPYNPPREHERRFATGRPDKPFIRNGNPNPIGDMLYKGGPDPGVTPADLQYLRDLYDDEINYLDGQLLHLFRVLEENGWLDDSVIVFAADHGEEFLEHGHIKHCRTVFDSSVKVPLFFHIPGVAARALEQPVQNLDIVPTLLDYLRIPTTGMTLEGKSLRPLIERQQPEDPYQYSLSGPYRGVADGRFKLIQNLAGEAFLLFDLKRDPGETRNILAGERRNFHRLRDALGRWLAQTEGQGRADESLRKAREAEEKLRSLGYLE
ncbi:MAG TPA: sulfatase [Thermoanaerobaculia bacterium]|nr:sulfatase [Thermoanaerobaculia bacterium]